MRELRAVLVEAQARGLLGPGPPDVQLAHASSFLALVEASLEHRPPDRWLELGSGGGLPGLVLATAWPESHGVLLDARSRSAEFLRWACGELELSGRVDVLLGRAEVLAHDPAHRERYAAVFARAVAAPPVVAELAAGFVVPGGVFVCSERPGGDVWEPVALARLGFELGPSTTDARATIRVLRKVAAAPVALPRRTGVPTKRPLW